MSHDLIAPERAVLGSECFRYDELPANLALLGEHRETVPELVTATAPVSELREALALFLSGRSAKLVVTQ